MLAIDLRLIVTDHPAHAELRVDAELCQLAPGPQRKVLAVAAAQFLEGAGMLPEVRLVKQLEVGHVLASLQERHDIVNRPHVHAALALEVLRERLARAQPERRRRHPHRHALPRRFASAQTRGQAQAR
jgi:hypothetical protein